MKGDKQYNAGFAWAAAELLSKRLTPAGIEKYTDDPIDETSFESGARDAATAYRSLLTTSEFQPKIIEREL